MKRFLSIVILILALIAVVVLLIKQPGYLALQLTHQSLTAPLWVALLGVIIAVIILALLWKGLVALFSIPSRIKQHFDRSHQEKQKQQLDAGLRAWVAQDWSAVETQFNQLLRAGWEPNLAQSIVQHAKTQNHKKSTA